MRWARTVRTKVVIGDGAHGYVQHAQKAARNRGPGDIRTVADGELAQVASSKHERQDFVVNVGALQTPVRPRFAHVSTSLNA